MKKEMLINVLQPEECRIAIVEDGVLEELYVERTSQESYVGNIYKGRIVNIEPSIQAAFVDFGVGRNGFLHVSDVEPAYYRHLEPRRGDSGGSGRDRGRSGGRSSRPSGRSHDAPPPAFGDDVADVTPEEIPEEMLREPNLEYEPDSDLPRSEPEAAVDESPVDSFEGEAEGEQRSSSVVPLGPGVERGENREGNDAAPRERSDSGGRRRRGNGGSPRRRGRSRRERESEPVSADANDLDAITFPRGDTAA